MNSTKPKLNRRSRLARTALILAWLIALIAFTYAMRDRCATGVGFRYGSCLGQVKS